MPVIKENNEGYCLQNECQHKLDHINSVLFYKGIQMKEKQERLQYTLFLSIDNNGDNDSCCLGNNDAYCSPIDRTWV